MKALFILLAPFTVSGQTPVVKLPMSFQQPTYQGTTMMSVGRQQTHSPQMSTGGGQNNGYNQQIMAEVEQHPREQQRRAAAVDDAFRSFESTKIHYEFNNKPAQGKDRYAASFIDLNKMLDGSLPLNLKRAVYLVESAYDTTLKFEEFSKQLDYLSMILQTKMKQGKIKPTDNIGKVMTIFQFMTDTLRVKNVASERWITTYPKTYDFNDFWGIRDYSKMFVSKLMRTGSGQCHSLPLLFLLLAEQLQADAHLAFAPNHSFIKFQDKRGNWHNIELTAGVFASDHFMIESGYIKAEALQNRIYLEPLTPKEVIIQCLNDLTMGYSRKYGYDDFVLKASETAISYSPNSITANQIYSNYYNTLIEYVAHQYMSKGLSQEKFKKDQRAMEIFTKADNALKRIDQLGYSDMPPEAYEAWLNSCKKEAAKQEHLNKIGVLKNMIQR